MSIGSFLHEHSGDYPPAAKFKKVGDEAKGIVQRAFLYTGLNLSGEEETSLVVQLDDEGDRVSVWFRPGSDMIRKLSRAVREAKPDQRKPTVQEGDSFRIAFTAEEPAKTKGFNARKVYEVTDYTVGELEDREDVDPQDLL